MNIRYDDHEEQGARMKVVGIGGAGGNAVNGMISKNLTGVEFIAINTDVQALEMSKASNKIQIGKSLTKGLGAGADPEIGRRAAEEDKDVISSILADTDMVFITGGMGGGSGTGGAPVIAEIANSLGALTVAIVTKPFAFESVRRMKQAEEGIMALRERVDTLIVIPNEKLLSLTDKNTTIMQAFELADGVLYKATKGIADLISVPGLINVDFADVRTVMTSAGDAILGIGTASGENRAVKAAEEAINSPLLEDVNILGATSILINFTGSGAMSLYEVNQAASIIKEAAGDDTNIIFGTVVDEKMGDKLSVTVIAAGLNKTKRAGEFLKKRRTEPFDEETEDEEALVYREKYKDYKKLSTQVYKTYDRPAFDRKNKEPEEVKKKGAKGESGDLFDSQKDRQNWLDDDHDIPGFIRKESNL